MFCRGWFRFRTFRLAWLVACGIAFASVGNSAAPARPLSPIALAATKDGARVFVACATGDVVLMLDREGAILARISVPAAPSGLALSPDGRQLAITCAAATSTVCLVDLSGPRPRLSAKFAAGHTVMAPVFDATGETLFVCHRFNDEVVAYDLKQGKPLARLKADREPIAAALTPDGKWLIVANHLPTPAGYGQNVSARITVIDAVARRWHKTLRLPNGSGLALGVAISPDGRHAAITHNLARFTLPTTQLERGWMNTAALTLLDLAQQEIINTVLLDNVELGAANPWAVAWTADGARLVVTHAGTHELSVIDFTGVLARLQRLPIALAPGEKPDPTCASNIRADVSGDLAFLVGLRRRVKLSGHGPRAVALIGEQAWVAGYFSDSVERVPLSPPAAGAPPAPIVLGPIGPLSAERRGERAFNDATLCFQQWQSCASCHSYDARVDGLSWDLLNDGIGNPKNAKSLLWSHRTPPAMSSGVRDSAEVAVRAGLRHILFAQATPDVPGALDAYLKSLSPAPSPRLENGKLSAAAQRGQRLFESTKVGCATCHPPKLFTDQRSYDVGTGGRYDPPGTLFDTPTLVEMWRTAPYLHDGSARTIRDVLMRRNPRDRHGTTNHLNDAQLDDLAAYVLSL